MLTDLNYSMSALGRKQTLKLANNALPPLIPVRGIKAEEAYNETYIQKLEDVESPIKVVTPYQRRFAA